MLVNSKISLSYVLKLWMEVVRSQSANTGAEFYPHEISYGGATFGIYFEKFENFDFLKGKLKMLEKCRR